MATTKISKKLTAIPLVLMTLAGLLNGTAVGEPASVEYIVYQRPDSSHYVFTDQCIPELEKTLKFKWEYRGEYKADGPLALGFRIVTDPSPESLAAIKSVGCVLAVDTGPTRRVAQGEDLIVPGYGGKAWEHLEDSLSYEKADCESYGGKFIADETYVGGQVDNGSSMETQVYEQTFRCEK